MLAEYGLIGWLFLTIIFTYLMWAAYATWVNTTEKGLQEALPRALALSSLLVLLLVSNAGFPWRLATTGALFALSLAILAASDIRLGHAIPLVSRALKWSPRASSLALVATGILSALAIFIAQQAIECESKIVRAIKIALTISQSGKATDPRWGDLKAEMLRLIRDGIAINPHYRKLTPTVADAMANWGDWENASWIWESVSESRPNVVALLANVTRAEIQIGNFPKAEQCLNRAIHIQPDSISLKTLQMMLWARTGREREAGIRAKELLHTQGITQDLVRTAYFLGMSNGDANLAIDAMEVRIKTWPEQAMDGWLKLGNIYASPELHNDEMALQSYRAAIDATEPQYKDSMRALIPRRFHAKLL
jgi:O-antigen ligase